MSVRKFLQVVMSIGNSIQDDEKPPLVVTDSLNSLVDVTDLYTIVLERAELGEDHFKTCRAHVNMIASQTQRFDDLMRDKEFLILLNNSKRSVQLHRKLNIKAGIPPKYRGLMWQLFTGTYMKAHVFEGIYFQLFLNQKLQPVATSEIERDVSRTFPTFEGEEFLKRLSNVLLAYSLRNPSLGYCQAMNFIAGTLLIFMGEENAFWVLVHIVEDLLPNYFAQSMSGLQADTRVFELLVLENLPKLARHFHKIHMNVSLMVTPWFLCLFVNYLPPETAFVVWDSILLDGVITLFEVALAILNLHQDKLMRIRDPIDTTHWLNKQLALLYDPEQLWSHVIRIDKNRIEAERQKIIKKVEEESKRKIEDKLLHELEHRTNFETTELRSLWTQYTSIDRFLYSGAVGLDFDLFCQVVRGTFSEWWPDIVLLKRLFALADTNEDGFVDFSEFAVMLSVICRGSFKKKAEYTFRLFDPFAKGSIDRFDVYRMLQSIYAMYLDDASFYPQVMAFVDMIFETVTTSADGTISPETFDDVISFQPRVMQRFCDRNPKMRYDLKKTLYYWLFDPDIKKKDLVKIGICRGNPAQDVPMHVVDDGVLQTVRDSCARTCLA